MTTAITDTTTVPVVVASGTASKPFAKAVVNETTFPTTENLVVALTTPQNSGPYTSLGTISDPLGGGTFDQATNTFTEMSVAIAAPTTATQVLQRLVYTAPTLPNGQSELVNAAIGTNNGTVTTALDPLNPLALDIATAPLVAGTIAHQPDPEIPISPFTTVSVTDTGFNNAAQDSASITVTDGGTVTDAGGSLFGPGLSKTGAGTYTVGASQPSQLQAELQKLLFTPTTAAAGTTVSFELKVTDTATALSTDDKATSVDIPATPITPITTGVPVFRFYDPSTEGHFFTSSISEVTQVESTRPDYTYEGIGFKAIDPASDANAVPVYRFYEGRNDSHFYTDSMAELKQIQATRPDMTLEGPAFSVDPTMQAGDVPVYRLYETRSDTHLYTTSMAEITTIQATRPDLVLEGPAFYVKT